MDSISAAVLPLLEEELEPLGNTWDSDRGHHENTVFENTGKLHYTENNYTVNINRTSKYCIILHFCSISPTPGLMNGFILYLTRVEQLHSPKFNAVKSSTGLIL